MFDKRKIKTGLFTVSLVFLLCFSLWHFKLSQPDCPVLTCLDVPVITNETCQKLGRHTQGEHYNQIFFQNERVALDRQTDTIYISQRITETSQIQDLEGSLTLENRFCSIFFLEDPMFEDLDRAVSEGHAFTLLIQRPFSRYSKYHVVFTTLPVIRMDGNYSHTNDDQRKVNLGEFVIWNELPLSCDAYSTKSTMSYWNYRGGLTTDFDKKSWRVSLVDEKRHKDNVSFLGMDADDDWILNALVMDDTKLRDKFSMDLWNSLAKTTSWNYPMSSGYYVELILNGNYAGIHLLQRRIDEKYLGLDPQRDILMKGRPAWDAENTGTTYEAESSFLPEAESCKEIEKAVAGSGNTINLSNFIDVSLLLQLTYGTDNQQEKNMFYVLDGEDDHFQLSWIPWDMDLTFANHSNRSPIESFDQDLTGMIIRQETSTIQNYVPDLDIRMANRWQELRQTCFSEENLLQLLQTIRAQLTASGALARDQAVWGLLYGENDSPRLMQDFLEGRLLYLDQYYSDLLKMQ